MPLINKSYLDSARLITRTPTYIVPAQSEENAIGFLLGKLALMEKEEEDFFALVEQLLPKLQEGLEDSRDLHKILQVNRDQLQETPFVNRPLTHLECDDETGAIYAKPVEEASEDEDAGHQEEASNQTDPPAFAQ